MYDLDRGFESIAPQIYADITELSLNQQVNLANHSLYSVLKPINGENTLVKGQAKWVISRGSRNRLFRVGQSYCPCCREIYQPHLLSAEKRHLNYCHQCGEKLQAIVRPLNEEEIATMKMLDNVFITNSGECFGKSVNAQVYFAMLRYFINLIRCASVAKSTYALARFMEQCGISQTEMCQTKTALAFEQLPVDERKNLLVNAVKMLKLSNKEFIQAIQQRDITQKAFAFECYTMELEMLFKHAPKGKTISRKVIKNKSKSDSILSMNR